jgi:hypothetical protein
MRVLLLAVVIALLVALFAAPAFAATNPNGTGQPSQDCADQKSSPSGFGTGGFANAESKYANPDSQGGTSSGNKHVVSQYDVACFQTSQH